MKICLIIFTPSWKHLVHSSGYRSRTGRLYKHIFIYDKVIFTYFWIRLWIPLWAILVNYTPVLNVKLVFLKLNFEMLGLFSLCIWTTINQPFLYMDCTGLIPIFVGFCWTCEFMSKANNWSRITHILGCVWQNGACVTAERWMELQQQQAGQHAGSGARRTVFKFRSWVFGLNRRW